MVVQLFEYSKTINFLNGVNGMVGRLYLSQQSQKIIDMKV